MTEMVEISLQIVEILAPQQAKYLHQKTQTDAHFKRSGDVEIVEILSDYLVTDIF
jgi:hypothetical protein